MTPTEHGDDRIVVRTVEDRRRPAHGLSRVLVVVLLALGAVILLPALVALVREPSSDTVVESINVVAGALSVMLGVCVAHNGRRMRMIGWMSDTALVTGAVLVSVLTHTGTAPLLEGCVWAGGGRSLFYLPLLVPLITAWWLWMSDPRRIVVAAERMDGLGASWNERHRPER
ncbi:hypothetical protein [Actinomyces radicidentis]|uniref:hypothetical protein n=1 Tax=Actinomyces radicidentis TaxID=111015 RepID=UPI0028EDB729|nr:hypothetical protein [Actinomyces radicidentis]